MDNLIGRPLAAAEALARASGVPLEVRRTASPRPFAGADLRIVRVRRLSQPERLEVTLAAFSLSEVGAE